MDRPAPALGVRGLLRRLAAALYDGFLVGALLMAITALALLASRGAALSSGSGLWVAILYRLLLIAVVFFYFGMSWTRSGETLGMKAWRLRLLRADGKPVRWRDAARRLLCAAPVWLAAAAGGLATLAHRVPVATALLLAVPVILSYLPLVFRRRSLPDRLSGTQIVQTERGA